MQRILLAILVFVPLMTAQNVVGAQQQAQKKSQITLKGTIDDCVVIVCKEVDDRVGVKYSGFNAYLAHDGIVRFFGTAEERFNFQKCMNNKGYPFEWH
jgi:hypothetical protein